MTQQIIDAVESSIQLICDLFGKEPTRFFTENDLVCCFHRILHDELSRLKQTTAIDEGQQLHDLIHCEYPTPFRCDMRGNRFEVKTDDDQTPKGKKFRRGRFDMVVLNPSFIGKYRYPVIKGQNYAEFQEIVKPSLHVDAPIALFGIEFVFCRDKIKPSRGMDSTKAAKEFVEKVLQDAKKLNEGLKTIGFMHKAMMLAFVKGTSGEEMDFISQRLQDIPTIRLSMAP